MQRERTPRTIHVPGLCAVRPGRRGGALAPPGRPARAPGAPRLRPRRPPAAARRPPRPAAPAEHGLTQH